LTRGGLTTKALRAYPEIVTEASLCVGIGGMMNNRAFHIVGGKAAVS